MSDEEVEIVARAIEAEICKPYEWSAEEFEIWWTKDRRNRNHDDRRAQARAALTALRSVGFTVSREPSTQPTPSQGESHP
ncbi:hypothetical protein ACVIGB_000592 [Bradyrhizobium sp. USDA 4341]